MPGGTDSLARLWMRSTYPPINLINLTSEYFSCTEMENIPEVTQQCLGQEEESGKGKLSSTMLGNKQV